MFTLLISLMVPVENLQPEFSYNFDEIQEIWGLKARKMTDCHFSCVVMYVNDGVLEGGPSPARTLGQI